MPWAGITVANHAINIGSAPLTGLLKKRDESNVDYRIRRSAVDGMDDANLAWKVIAPLWDALSASANPKKEQETLAQATEGQRLLIGLDWCQKEVRNGGFEQFFLNSTGVLWLEALEGFRRIGAEPYAALLEQALGIFPDGEAPLARTARTKLLRSLPKDRRRSLFEPLEDAFFQLLRSKEWDLEKYRAAYVRAHPEQFFHSSRNPFYGLLQKLKRLGRSFK